MYVKGQPKPAGSGRKAGTPNKATVRRRLEEAAGLKEQWASIQSKEMPLDYLLRKMRDPASAPAEQFLAARSAAPYCHAMLQAHAHQHMDATGKPIAPVISVTIVGAVPEQTKPALTHTPPKSDETKQ